MKNSNKQTPSQFQRTVARGMPIYLCSNAKSKWFFTWCEARAYADLDSRLPVSIMFLIPSGNVWPTLVLLVDVHLFLDRSVDPKNSDRCPQVEITCSINHDFRYDRCPIRQPIKHVQITDQSVLSCWISSLNPTTSSGKKNIRRASPILGS